MTPDIYNVDYDLDDNDVRAREYSQFYDELQKFLAGERHDIQPDTEWMS